MKNVEEAVEKVNSKKGKKKANKKKQSKSEEGQKPEVDLEEKAKTSEVVVEK